MLQWILNLSVSILFQFPVGTIEELYQFFQNDPEREDRYAMLERDVVLSLSGHTAQVTACREAILKVMTPELVRKCVWGAKRCLSA